jgi:gas vesicle protein GvpG
MGLITGLLTLPLAPVRGTVWLAQVLQAEAESREFDEPAILAALEELEVARAAGEFTAEEIEEAENELVEQLMALRGTGGQESYGQIG